MSAAAAGEARASALAAPNRFTHIHYSLFLVRLFVARQSKRGNPLLGS